MKTNKSPGFAPLDSIISNSEGDAMPTPPIIGHGFHTDYPPVIVVYASSAVS